MEEDSLLVRLTGRLMEKLTLLLLLHLPAINLLVLVILILTLLPRVPVNLRLDEPMTLLGREVMSLLEVPMNHLEGDLIEMVTPLPVDRDLLGNVLSLEVGDLQMSVKSVKSVKVVGNFDSEHCIR